MQGSRIVFTQPHILSRHIVNTIPDRDLQLAVPERGRIVKKGGCTICDDPIQVFLQERNDVLWLKTLESAHTRVWTVLVGVGAQILGQGRGDGDRVFVYEVLFALGDAVGARRVVGGGEDVGVTDFVFFRHETLWLVFFDVADEEMHGERSVEGKS